MKYNSTIISAIIALVAGFVLGFVLRPIISPTPVPATVAGAAAIPSTISAEPRSRQYFTAHIDEARQVVAGCRAGSVRGDECANADEAVVEADGRERFGKFFGH